MDDSNWCFNCLVSQIQHGSAVAATPFLLACPKKSNKPASLPLHKTCQCLTPCASRNIIREGYHIKGNCVMDILCAGCCLPCSNCQVLSEAETRGNASVSRSRLRPPPPSQALRRICLHHFLLWPHSDPVGGKQERHRDPLASGNVRLLP
jgi:Cys-rich protein (TIGR01571 family)